MTKPTKPKVKKSPVKSFFANSDLLDHAILRPLSHILPNWELSWDQKEEKYAHEEQSYARLLNELIDELENTVSPAKYHDNEDRLAEYTKKHLKWKIEKIGNRWIGDDYHVILEQGGFNDIDQVELIQAAAGRIKAARIRGQTHFDQMEESHRGILASVMTIILYHRTEPDA